jgi:Oxidoreductase-like protein, N-terminal
MSGCEKCVWIQYAKDLTDMYKDSGETARKVILEKIKDPTMQVFLKMELSSIKDL